MSGQQQFTAGASQPAPQQGAQQGEDYMDKGLDAIEKKFGMDTNKYRSTNEKITDKIRTYLEKVTGKKAPAKLSN